MGNYKLVPESIVDELSQFIRQVDGNNRMGAGSLADKICERFCVSEPDMQGEPVGWQYYQDGKWWNGDDRIHNHRKHTEEARYPIREVYAAPQPEEQQQDDRSVVRLDKQYREDVADALGFIRGGNYAWSYLLQQNKDITSAAEAQQPAPNVSALVEALESIMEYIPLGVVNCREDYCRELWCASCFGEEAESYRVTAVRRLKSAKTALTSYRSQEV